MLKLRNLAIEHVMGADDIKAFVGLDKKGMI
jgi:hypothetical protein